MTIQSVINLAKNLVIHSRTKHIDVKHHFIYNHIDKNDIVTNFVEIKFQLASIFTKPLSTDKSKFKGFESLI